MSIRPKTLQNRIQAVRGLKNVVRSRATWEASVNSSASSLGSDVMCSEVDAKMLLLPLAIIDVIGAAVLERREEEKRASSMPSRYILIVLVLDLRLVKDGNDLVTRPLVMVTDEAAIRHTAAVERFILDSVSFYYLCLFNE